MGFYSRNFYSRSTCGTQHLSKNGMQVARAGTVQQVTAVVMMSRYRFKRMPSGMRERALLCEEQDE